MQHIPPLFTGFLAERLTTNSALKFSEGVEGDALQPGRAYIAPGGKHMEIAKLGFVNRIKLHEGPPENSCRPAVDVLFRSVVGLYGGNVLGVILTGMGQDGLRGCELIREQGGQVLAQDEASSVVWECQVPSPMRGRRIKFCRSIRCAGKSSGGQKKVGG